MSCLRGTGEGPISPTPLGAGLGGQCEERASRPGASPAVCPSPGLTPSLLFGPHCRGHACPPGRPKAGLPLAHWGPDPRTARGDTAPRSSVTSPNAPSPPSTWLLGLHPWTCPVTWSQPPASQSALRQVTGGSEGGALPGRPPLPRQRPFHATPTLGLLPQPGCSRLATPHPTPRHQDPRPVPTPQQPSAAPSPASPAAAPLVGTWAQVEGLGGDPFRIYLRGSTCRPGPSSLGVSVGGAGSSPGAAACVERGGAGTPPPALLAPPPGDV